MEDVCLEGGHDAGKHNLEVLPMCRTRRFDAEGWVFHFGAGNVTFEYRRGRITGICEPGIGRRPSCADVYQGAPDGPPGLQLDRLLHRSQWRQRTES
jgi:hypothetical protein